MNINCLRIVCTTRTNMRFTPVLLAVVLSCSLLNACASAENSVGRALDNANSLISNKESKVWGSDNTNNNQKKKTEQGS